MSFTSVKQKDSTQIYFENRDKRNYGTYILFLFLQIFLISFVRFYYELLDNVYLILMYIGGFLITVFFIFILVKKSLRLSRKSFAIEYRVFGLLLYKRSFFWTQLQKVAVELTRLKDHDILFQINKNVIYLGESLGEEESDALLKEIQLFHHYYF